MVESTVSLYFHGTLCTVLLQHLPKHLLFHYWSNGAVTLGGPFMLSQATKMSNYSTEEGGSVERAPESEPGDLGSSSVLLFNLD
jgi:hypothetical protein